MTMRVRLDDQPCAEPADTVSSAIAAAAEQAQQNGRLIVEVLVDGERWQQADLSAVHPAERTAREVAIATADATELINEALAEAESVLEELINVQRQAGELLERGEDEPAMEKLSEAVSHWLSVQQAVSMSVDVMQIQGIAAPDEQATEAAVSSLSSHLQVLRDCLQHHDTLGLSDTLLYDLPEAAERWRELVSTLRSSVIESL